MKSSIYQVTVCIIQLAIWYWEGFQDTQAAFHKIQREKHPGYMGVTLNSEDDDPVILGKECFQYGVEISTNARYVQLFDTILMASVLQNPS